MTEKITYNRLYSDMVKLFAVKQDGKEDMCLGDYMRARSQNAKQVLAQQTAKKNANLPVAVKKPQAREVVGAFFTYVNEKLTVKKAPLRDITIRRFPLRTALSSVCCAFIICALAVCYGVAGLRGGDDSSIASEPLTEITECYDTLGFDEYEDIV